MKPEFYSFIIKMTEGREDADEVFQETWFRALKNIHKFQHKNFKFLLIFTKQLHFSRFRKIRPYTNAPVVINFSEAEIKCKIYGNNS